MSDNGLSSYGANSRLYTPDTTDMVGAFENACYILNNVSLSPGVVRPDIARNFAPEFAIPFANTLTALEKTGFKFRLESGTRDIETQITAARSNPYAAPGFDSLHLRGCAADISHDPTDGHTSAEFYAAYHRLAQQNGLEILRPHKERGHVQLAGNVFWPGLHEGLFPIVDPHTAELEAEGMYGAVRRRHPHNYHALTLANNRHHPDRVGHHHRPVSYASADAPARPRSSRRNGLAPHGSSLG